MPSAKAETRRDHAVMTVLVCWLLLGSSAGMGLLGAVGKGQRVKVTVAGERAGGFLCAPKQMLSVVQEWCRLWKDSTGLSVAFSCSLWLNLVL